MQAVLLAAIVCCIAGILLCAFIEWRNQIVYEVRLAFIDADDFPRSYDKLPSYEEMLFHPRHLRRWTVKQWHAYIGA